MQRIFGTAAISAAAWGRIIVVSASVLFLVELEKYLLRKYRKNAVVKKKHLRDL